MAAVSGALANSLIVVIVPTVAVAVVVVDIISALVVAVSIITKHRKLI